MFSTTFIQKEKPCSNPIPKIKRLSPAPMHSLQALLTRKLMTPGNIPMQAVFHSNALKHNRNMRPIPIHTVTGIHRIFCSLTSSIKAIPIDINPHRIHNSIVIHHSHIGCITHTPSFQYLSYELS